MLVVGGGSVNLGIGTISDPGPGMYSFVMACAGATLSIALTVSGLRGTQNPSAPAQSAQANWSAVGITMLALVVYVLLLPVFGIAATSVALLAALFWLGGLRNFGQLAILSLFLGIGAELACRLVGIPTPDALIWQLIGGT